MQRLRASRTIAVAFLAVTVPVAGLAAGTGLAAVRSDESTTGATPPRDVLSRFVCQKAFDPPARAVSVTAVMRPLAGTRRLAVEFDLQQRTNARAAWTSVNGPGLGVFVSPTDPPTLGQRPGDVWYVRKPVADLAAPDQYRFEVTFRWTGVDDQAIGTRTLTSRVCDEPELRPDLVVDSITIAPAPTNAQDDRYTAVVEDTGPTGAGPFTVELSDDGDTVEKTISHIDPHARTSVTFVGPVCSASDPPTVTVDPQDLVDVSSRSQAVLQATCPAPVSS